MPKKKKESVNYLDQIPRISVPKWEVLEDGLVEVTVENKGFIWKEIDGEQSIYEIGQILEQTHEGASNQLYERLSAYFETLRRLHYIQFH